MKAFPILTLCLLTPAVHAQERTAGNALDTQMTWSTLNAKVTTANNNAQAAHFRLDQMEKCNQQGKTYAPGNGADKDGCKPVFDPKELEIKTGVVALGRNACGKGADSCYVDKATIEQLCKTAGFTYATGISVASFDSPGDNTCGRWTGTKWQVFGAKKDNRHLSALTCQTIKWK